MQVQVEKWEKMVVSRLQGFQISAQCAAYRFPFLIFH